MKPTKEKATYMDSVKRSLTNLEAIAERRMKNQDLRVVMKDFAQELNHSLTEPCPNGSASQVSETELLVFLQTLKVISVNEMFLKKIPKPKLLELLKIMRPACGCEGRTDCPPEKTIDSLLNSLDTKL